MTTLKRNQKVTQVARKVTAAALIAGFVFAPATGSAGLLDNAKSRVQQAAGKVTELRNSVQAKVEDVKDKVEELDSDGLEQTKEMVASMLEFVKKIQAGYKDFAGTDNCGQNSPCGAFRAKLRKMIVSFANLPQELPFVETIPPAVKQLEEMAQLVDHMPPPILYATEKVLGTMFDEVQYRLEVVRFAAAQVPQLPTMAELSQGAAYPSSGDRTAVNTKNSSPSTRSSSRNSSGTGFPFCSALLDTSKPHIELLQASIKTMHETLSDIAAMMPNEQTLGVSFVGGVTVSIKNPPKGALDAIILIARTIERKLTLKMAVTKSVCALAGYTPPSN